MKSCTTFIAGLTAGALLGAVSGCAGNPSCDSPACRQDAAITAEVRALLDQHPGLSPEQIHPETHERVVYLYGVVDNRLEWQDAQEVAGHAQGVAQVVNLLGINNK